MSSDEIAIDERHRELHHYTTFDGFSGIVRSSQLWATDYRYLNDTTEVEHLRCHLVNALTPHIVTYIRNTTRTTGLRLQREISKRGGILSLARKEATTWVRNFYEATFSDLAGRESFLTPHIVSFCSHADDHKYEQENGLLSQWGRYARGGVALVFDTKKLGQLLRKESASYEYTYLGMLDVIYNDGTCDFSVRFSDLIDSMSRRFREFTETGSPDAGQVLEPLLKSAVRFKHRGFREEREVRIVACPTSAELHARMKRDQKDYIPAADKLKITHRDSASSGRAYIPLFDFQRPATLPINRVIVGPHPDQEGFARRVRAVLAERRAYAGVSVVRSETPLREKLP